MFRLLPGQFIALVAVLAIMMGTLLLLLPWSTPAHVHLKFLDALFTATSAICVTGLIVLDTSKDFTIFGQLIILFLVQIGGLGYATMATLLLLAAGQRIGLRDRMMLAEALNVYDMAGLIKLVKIVVIITFTVEGLGAALLTLQFSSDMPLGQAAYHGTFHAISAFNNAGFSTFPDNLIRYRLDWSVNVTVALLIIGGGLGFLVYRDLWDNFHAERFRVHTHTKLVLLVSLILLILGTAMFSIMEWGNPKSLGGLTAEDRLISAFFHSVSARTAGFNTLDMGQIRDDTLYFFILIMVVGGSPGSTAGGIKTTTLGIVCLSILNVLRRKEDVVVFHRRIPTQDVNRAVSLALLAMGTITLFTLILASMEPQPFLSLMFEVTSALATVGYSVGDGGILSLSAILSPASKSMIIFCMLFGRFGPLLIGLFAIRSSAHILYRHPEARIAIG